MDGMDVPVQQHSGSQLPDEPVKRGETLMRVIGGVTHAEWWGVGDDDVDAAAEPTPEPCTRLQPQGPPAHLALGVLVGTLLVSEGPAETGDVQACCLEYAALGAVTALGPGYGVAQCVAVPGPCTDGIPAQVRVVVAEDVDQRHPRARNQVFQVLERQVTARQDDVRPQ